MPNEVPKPRIRAERFRVFERFDWAPSGVCLLSGANGAGKSTALDILLFLRILFERGHEAAFQRIGARHFRNAATAEDQPVEFELIVGDVRWKLRFPMSSSGIKDTFGEELYFEDKPVLRAAMFQQKWFVGAQEFPLDDVRCCAKVYWDRDAPPWMKAFVGVLSGIRVHSEYWLNSVRKSEPIGTRQKYLHQTGANLWSVLGGWRGAPSTSEGRFEWVMSAARRAFPGLISTVEFPEGFPMLFPVGAADAEGSLPPERAADGLLVGLLHLTAVAGAAPGSIVAFDEPENHLHPHAIRSLFASMRERAEEKDLTIILTTHSPVVMNEFRDEPERVFVLEPSAPDQALPSVITELHSEEWLAQARLGTLYERLAFGSPLGVAPERRDEAAVDDHNQ